MKRFLRDLFGSRPALPREVADAIAKLDEVAHSKPALAAPSAVLRAVLPELVAEPAEAPSQLPSAEAAQARLSAGTPILHGEPIAMHAEPLRRRALAICKAVQQHQPSAAA